MIEKFTESFHCHSRAHCEVCRMDGEWRAKVGAPEVCPWNMKPPKVVVVRGGCCGGETTPGELQARLLGLSEE